MNIKHIVLPTNVTFFRGLVPTNVNSSHECFEQIKAAVLADDIDLAESLTNTKVVIQAMIKGTKDLQIVDEQVMFRGQVLRTTLAERILELAQAGQDITAFSAFLVNLYDNPSNRAVNELFDFLEASKLPLTEDGCFVAYKAVNSDYKDYHSGTFDNSKGATCEMPRNAVDEDKDRTCSHGLHFAAYTYAKDFMRSNGRLMAIKINPKDVVSIPSDYNNEKGRCCKYVVVDEITTKEDTLKDTPVYGETKVNPKTIGDLIREQMAPKFSVGDKVIVIQRELTQDGPVFTKDMLSTAKASPNKVYTIVDIDSRNWVTMENEWLAFLPEWLAHAPQDALDEENWDESDGEYMGELKNFPVGTKDAKYKVQRSEDHYGNSEYTVCKAPVFNAKGSLVFKYYDSADGSDQYITVTEESFKNWRSIYRV